MGCTHQFQAYSDWCKILVVTLATTRKSLVLLLKSMDQIAETAFQIQKVLAHTVVGSVDEPKARESFRMGQGAKKDALGNISPNNIGPIFSTFIVELAHLDTILKDVAQETRFLFLRVLQENTGSFKSP